MEATESVVGTPGHYGHVIYVPWPGKWEEHLVNAIDSTIASIDHRNLDASIIDCDVSTAAGCFLLAGALVGLRAMLYRPL